MAATKTKTERIGKISFFQYANPQTGSWEPERWKVQSRSKKFKRTITVNSKSEAIQKAKEWNNHLIALEHTPEDVLSDEQLEQTRKAFGQIQLINSQLTEEQRQKGEEVSLTDAIAAYAKLKERYDAFMVKYKGQRFGNFDNFFEDAVHQMSKLAKSKTYKSYGVLIDEFVKHKCGPNGNKATGGKLEAKTIKEWRHHMHYLKEWIGKENPASDKKHLNRLLIKNINDYRTITNTKPSESTLKKFGTQIKAFGKWCAEEEYIPANPFLKVGSTFKKSGDREIVTAENNHVMQQFAVAMHDKNTKCLIPYLALYFFSTLRPEEIADPQDPKRQLHKSQILLDVFYKEIPDACHIDVKAYHTQTKGRGVIKQKMSKKNKNRQGLLFGNGIKWLNWAEENGGIPNTIFASRRKLTRLKKLSNTEEAFGNDWGRHTVCSASCKNYTFDGVIDFLCRRFGHSQSTQEEHYEYPFTPARAEEFFNITPETVSNYIKKNPFKNHKVFYA